MRYPVSLKQLKESFQKGTLGSLTTFHTLGRYVKTTLGGDRGGWRDYTLKNLGDTLRKAIPGVLGSGDLSPLLQKSIRIANAFSVARIREIERQSESGKLRLSVSHLDYIASACDTDLLRQQWIDKCIAEEWGARRLHTELMKTFAPDPRGGKRYSTPENGILSIELATRKLERVFTEEKGLQQWTALKSKEKAALQSRLSGCLAKLKKLKNIKWRTAGGK